MLAAFLWFAASLKKFFLVMNPTNESVSSSARKPELLGLTPSFGFGDRIGCAAAGHVAAMRRSGHSIAPIFPQQSIREMTRTSRTAEQVMRESMSGAIAAGWTGPIGADADHLKTNADVDVTAAAGFTFFTIDPSEHVDQKADNYSAESVAEKFENIRSQIDWFSQYVGKTVTLGNGTKIQFSELDCKRAAVKYGAAIRHAIELAKYIDQTTSRLGRSHEIEISVDETEQPTTLAEHYIIAEQCLRGGMKLVSLAPRFIGDFEKGVDYRGDLLALDKSLQDHAAIASQLGPYKLSLHSGSDKLSMYGIFARATKGLFHVKTAGTSYLESLRVLVRHEPKLFREIITYARSRYDTDKATYHVSATLKSAPEASAASDVELEREYLEIWSEVPNGVGFTKLGRQILHCTFGAVLTHSQFGPQLRDCLKNHADTYTEILEDHFSRHLEALRF